MRIHVLRSFIDAKGYATRGTQVDRPNALANYQITRGFALRVAKKTPKAAKQPTPVKTEHPGE